MPITPPTIRKHAWEGLVFYTGLLLFGVLALFWSVVAALLHFVLPRRIGAPLGQRVVAVLSRGYLGLLQAAGLVRCDLGALDPLREAGALIIAPNHPSLLDVLLVVSRLPRVTCIIKSEIRANPLLGGSARLAGYICNRHAKGMLRTAQAVLRARGQVLIFPEGTRTRGGTLNHFKGGFALVARNTRVPVQTVFIEASSPFLGKGWPLLRRPEFPLVYRARLGRRFTVDGDLRRAVGELEDYYRHALAGDAPLPTPDPAPSRPYPAT